MSLLLGLAILLATLATSQPKVTIATLATLLANLATSQPKVYLVETGEPGAREGEVDKCLGSWSPWGECQGPGEIARAGQGRQRECGGAAEGRWRSCGGGNGADYSTPLKCGGKWQDWGPCSR